jgi:hypothetical protein
MNYSHLQAKKVLLDISLEALAEAQNELDSNLEYFDFVMNADVMPTPVLIDELLLRIKMSFNKVVEFGERVQELKNI